MTCSINSNEDGRLVLTHSNFEMDQKPISIPIMFFHQQCLFISCNSTRNHIIRALEISCSLLFRYHRLPSYRALLKPVSTNGFLVSKMQRRELRNEPQVGRRQVHLVLWENNGFVIICQDQRSCQMTDLTTGTSWLKVVPEEIAATFGYSIMDSGGGNLLTFYAYYIA